MSIYTSSRREFLKIAGQAGAVLLIGFNGAGKLFAAGLTQIGDENADAWGSELELNNFILITPDNKITIFNPRPEMGQGTLQSMPALIAEELEVSLDMVDIRMSNGAKKYGPQGVGGSASVRESWIPLREAGAAAKEMLVKAAANRWSCAEADCVAADAKIQHRSSGKTLTYGELVADAAKLEVPKSPKLKDPKDFKILGKSMRRPDLPAKVNGSAVFGIDITLPGMVYASVQHCPLIHGKIVSFNESEVAAMPGVVKVLKTERKMPHKAVPAVAVVANTYWSALKARRALQIEWDNTGYEDISTDDYYAKTREKAAKQEGFAYNDAVGDVKATFAKAAKVLESMYETPFASHAQIEPMNATVWVQGDKVEVWAPVQSIDGTISAVAKYLGVPKENVKVNSLLMGGSFGRKGYTDFVLEAAHIAKQIDKPVKMIWTREDDLANGPYRPGMISAMKGALDANGNLIAWEHKVAGASIAFQAFGEDLSNKPDDWVSEGIDQATSPYIIPNRRQAFVHHHTDIPIVWWRSVYSSTSLFGHECFMDEMAHAAGKDPLDFRISMLKNEPRWLALLQFLETKSNYRAQKAAGKAVGIAVANSFGSFAAYAITVSKKGAGVKIDNVIGVVDCGLTVNPDTVRAQTEGNVVMALSTAIKPGITFVGGEAQESNFNNYPLLRISEMPPVEIHVMENQEAPGGAGEPGLPPFTPALFNAVFLATGKRVVKLPVDLENL
ncbi:MAG: molybdopterin cofactor-binding domain-containing protein [Bacteroidota bacterium]